MRSVFVVVRDLTFLREIPVGFSRNPTPRMRKSEVVFDFLCGSLPQHMGDSIRINHTVLWLCQHIRSSVFLIQSKYFIFFWVRLSQVEKMEETLEKAQDPAFAGHSENSTTPLWNSRLNPAGRFQRCSGKDNDSCILLS